MIKTKEQLLDEETLDFKRVSGVFDVDKVAAAIADIGFSFRDESDPSMFVISSEAKAREIFQARRRADPSRGFPYVLLVQVRPALISVDPVADGALRDLSRQFIDWLTTTYKCRVSNEFGTDLTKALKAETKKAPKK